MNWDDYINRLIASTRDAKGVAHCDKVCIIGLDGSFWTTTNHPNAIKLSRNEARTIAECFKAKDFTPYMGSMVYIENRSHVYTFLKEDEGKILYARGGGCGSYTLQASKTAVVIGHCQENWQQGNLNKGVYVIASHLESLGI